MIYKSFDIKAADFGVMKVIKVQGKGSVPKGLRGLFTSEGDAMSAIDKVVSIRGIKDGQTKE